MTIQEAVKVLIEALRTDEDYRRSWTANIAMAFKDEAKGKIEVPFEVLHQVANTAAENFIDLLTYESNPEII